MEAVQRTILVVEDEPLIQMAIAENLKGAGFSVVVTKSAEEAIDILTSRTRIDLVFSDVKLAGPMSGVGLAKWVRDWNRALPIILASGQNEAMIPLDRQRAFPFLAKPFGADEVLDAINKALG